MLRTRSPRKEKISNCYLHSNSLSNKMDNSLLAVRDINHKYIVVGKEKIMQKFEKGFFVGAATAAHQVEGNNIHSDYWAQEQLPHTSFTEPSGIACDHYNKYEEDIKLLADAGLNAHSMEKR